MLLMLGMTELSFKSEFLQLKKGKSVKDTKGIVKVAKETWKFGAKVLMFM